MSDSTTRTTAAPFGACSECGHVFGVCTPRLCPACGHAVMTQAEYDERKHIPLPTTTAACDGSSSCAAEDHIVGCRVLPIESPDGYSWWPVDSGKESQ